MIEKSLVENTPFGTGIQNTSGKQNIVLVFQNHSKTLKRVKAILLHAMKCEIVATEVSLELSGYHTNGISEKMLKLNCTVTSCLVLLTH